MKKYALLLILCLVTLVHAEQIPMKLAVDDLDNPKKYAFITDSEQTKIAVIDAFANQFVGTIKAKTIAELIGISKEGAFLAYAKKGEKSFYTFDLLAHTSKKVTTSHPIQSLLVSESGEWLFYAYNNGIGIVSLKQQTENDYSFDGTPSLTYQRSTQTLFITELENGALWSFSLKDKTKKQLFNLGEPMSSISIMPNGMGLFFISDNQLKSYSMLDEELLDMPTITASQFRPYVTSDSRKVLLVNARNKTPMLSVVNSYSYSIEKNHQLKQWTQPIDERDTLLKTGWLEKNGLVFGQKTLYSFTLNKSQSVKKIHFDKNTEQTIEDILVQSDTKTALITLNKNNLLQVFDIRKQKAVKTIELPLSNPHHIIMGETNTLCH